MANPGYLRSTDGSDADNGSTWALANATLAGAITDAAAGDTIFVSQSHSESPATSTTWTFPGTPASPNKLICGNDAAEPPTAVATTAAIGVSSNSSALIVNGSLYAYGINWNGGSGTGGNVTFGNTDTSTQLHENCVIGVLGTSTGRTLIFGLSGANNENFIRFKNCTFTFSSVNHSWLARRKVLIEGGSTAGSALTTMFQATAELIDITVSGLNMATFASTVTLIAAGQAGTGQVTFRNCKLPASWTGSLLGGAPATYGFRARMHNCDSGDTQYRLWEEDLAGSIKSETTIVRTGGASDGTTSLSWKMATSASAVYPMYPLASPEIAIWNDTTGSAKTLTVEIVHDSQGAGSGSKFQDDEVWLEVMYLGTSGFPLGTWISDCKADILATAANQADSSVTWTTTGLTTPVKQALSVSFTPQEKGYFIARVMLAKASKTCYVDPKITVT